MKEIGIPEILYRNFNIDLALEAVKNYVKINELLSQNKEDYKDKGILNFINFDEIKNEIIIKYFDPKNNRDNINIIKNSTDKIYNFLLNEESNLKEINDILRNFIKENEKNFKETKDINKDSINELNIKINDIILNKIEKNYMKDFNKTNNQQIPNQLKLNYTEYKYAINENELKNLFKLNEIQKENGKDILNDFNSFKKLFNLKINQNDNLIIKEGEEMQMEKGKEINTFIKIKDKNVKINIENFLDNLTDEELLDFSTFKINLRIKNVIKTESGKWPSILGNTIAFDSNHSINYINKNLAEKIKYLIKKNFNIEIDDKILEENLKKYNKIEINKYVPFVNIVLNDKFEIYRYDENTQRRNFAKITDKILRKLGYNYPVTSQTPLYIGFKFFNIVKIFLKNILNSIIFFLWILSFMLVYSLILSNVDEKNYEFGMLRSLGFKKSNLMQIIIFQSLFFSIPAIIFGLIIAFFINIPISNFFFTFAGIETNYMLSNTTIILGIIAGLTLPLISSYFPIKKALSSNLKDSLAIFSKKITDISVNIVKLERLGISPSLLLSSIILIILGFITYYLAPMAFLKSDFSTFLFILNSILIMMIIGMILLMQIFVPKIQKFILNIIIFIFSFDKNLKFLISKNLDGHFVRNQKSSVMFMIALSFVIFSGCTIILICNFIISATKNVFGSDIWVWQQENSRTLNEKELIRYINDFDSKFPNSIKNYTFISMPMNDFIQRSMRLSTLIGI
jgi:ABC-type antimicrobial peptide transport system permease subunit